MSNPYYNHASVEFPEGSLARGTPIDAELTAIAAAFAALPSPAPGGTGFTQAISVGTATTAGQAMQFGQFLTWLQDVSANNHKLTNLADPTSLASKDAANAAWVIAQINAFLIAGGVPSNVPITGLGKGSATALQIIRINAGGTAVEGHTEVIGDISIGAAAALDQIRVNAGGTAFETFTPASVDTDLWDASSAVFAYQNF